jgi:IS6 family transposase
MRQERPALFRGRHFADEIIVLCVRRYLRYSLSYRDLAEIMSERNLFVYPSTIWRWVQRYAPELNVRIRRELKPTNGSWRTDETYVRVAGRWTYLYRAVDSTGATIDFLLSETRDLTAARNFFQKALASPGHPRPRVITVDGNPSYPTVIDELKQQTCSRSKVLLPSRSLSEQHSGTRSSCHQTAGQCLPGFSFLRWRPKNDSRL